MKYPQIQDGEWYNPSRKGHKEMCCDCKLVHKTEYKIDDQGTLWIKSTRDNRATSAARRVD